MPNCHKGRPKKCGLFQTVRQFSVNLYKVRFRLGNDLKPTRSSILLRFIQSKGHKMVWKRVQKSVQFGYSIHQDAKDPHNKIYIRFSEVRLDFTYRIRIQAHPYRARIQHSKTQETREHTTILSESLLILDAYPEPKEETTLSPKP